ncbi:MAG: pantoate--beta-alanine ligase [Bacteroidales bacterium]|nr:pantoate--beta-alanine ligase [Bacteroidales bacterium]MBN2817647.1 pantoate--beta-alanine ligase [Bacteroidales bacterium]
MKILKTISELRSELNRYNQKNLRIGFVPTMGALHEGHLSLVKQSVSENFVTVVSVFVNPTQFNDKKDLERYPRDLEKDCKLLKPVGCNLVFAPSVDEMYPEPDTRRFDFGELETVMEGAHRPGHFNGVGQIVSKLFDIVQPNRAYFGLKDFQQLAIIRKLVKDYHYPVEIVPCAIVRESDGLAMSSRNMLLTEEHRNAAPFIYHTLNKLQELTINSTTAAKEFIRKQFAENKFLDLEYFEIVDDENLQPVDFIEKNRTYSACIAVFAGKIRLIDNVQLNS